MEWILAPLAGFTNAAFRRLAFEGGADRCVTEMVSAAGLAHGSSPTHHLMECLPGEGRVTCQIFGSKPEELAFAAHEIARTKRFVSLDLNAGCPMTKIVKEGAGAALVKDPQLVYHCLKAMVDAAEGLPVTVKTRPGTRPDKSNVFELLDAAEQAGASAFTLHGRFTSQMHGGPVHLDLLAEVVARARITVVGNGGVVDHSSAQAMAQTGVQGIMIGRAALAKPWIFNALKGKGAVLDGFAETPPNGFKICHRHLDYLLAFRNLLAEKYPTDYIPSVDGIANVTMHTHLFRYFNGIPGAAQLRARLNTIRTREEINALLAAFEQKRMT